ncbi:phenylacetate--CoA ligase family protein [Streptomyces sp. AJS327]|uniref:phenylacetate--CoA ligase family protein n=1 Tax=Streptomyces sp. AJS327 TaxID=2545265 RepID=UPI0015DDC21D|nr:phenylacetate--CoA ligase family protein [Streptomyces sp. AJS327]MBA0053688.1 phenylacetate--CoA ligase family protein [Streptomyces sp. AJS327]
MPETYFAPEAARTRMTAEEFLAAYPDVAFDRERDAADRAEAGSIRARLAEFAAFLENGPPEPFRWTEREAKRVSAHPVYQGEAFEDAAFDALPTLSRSVLRGLREPFDYAAAGADTVYADQTSGTSGAPLTVVYSPRFMAEYLHLNNVKVAMVSGVPEVGRRPVFAVRVTDSPDYRGGILVPNPLDEVGLSLILYLDTGDPESFAELDRTLTDLAPEVLVSKPSLHRIMLQHWASEGREEPPCRPLLTVSGGAMLPPELRADLTEFYRCPVSSNYASSEGGHLGSECALGRMHLDESVHEHFELVDPLGGAADEPGIGELTVTSLSNDCMPLVRYRTGDLARISRERCACGQFGTVLEELRGRTSVVFDLGEGALLSPTRYMNLFKELPELREYQLTQREPRGFRLRMELRPEVRPEEHEAAYLRVRDAIAAGMPVPVALEWEGCVFETEGAKFARFRCEVTA